MVHKLYHIWTSIPENIKMREGPQGIKKKKLNYGTRKTVPVDCIKPSSLWE